MRHKANLARFKQLNRECVSMTKEGEIQHANALLLNKIRETSNRKLKLILGPPDTSFARSTFKLNKRSGSLQQSNVDEVTAFAKEEEEDAPWKGGILTPPSME